jgi:hypothetical protein
LKVEGNAAASLSTLHKGDKVMLSCRSDSNGSSARTAPDSDSMDSSRDADCDAVTSISKSH